MLALLVPQRRRELRWWLREAFWSRIHGGNVDIGEEELVLDRVMGAWYRCRKKNAM